MVFLELLFLRGGGRKENNIMFFGMSSIGNLPILVITITAIILMRKVATPWPGVRNGGGVAGGDTEKDIGMHVNFLAYAIVNKVWPSLHQFC